MSTYAYTNSFGDTTYVPMLDNGKVLTMPQGGPIQYRIQVEAERHADLFQKGYTDHAVPRDACEI